MDVYNTLVAGNACRRKHHGTYRGTGRRSWRRHHGLRDEGPDAQGRHDHGRHQGPEVSLRAVQPLGRRRLAQAREDIAVDLAPAMAEARHRLHAGRGAEGSRRRKTGSNWWTATRVRYDYLVIATGPELAFDEIEGLGPQAAITQSVCHIDHAEKAARGVRGVLQEPRPDHHRRRAGRLLLRPGLRIPLHPRNRAAPRARSATRCR